MGHGKNRQKNQKVGLGQAPKETKEQRRKRLEDEAKAKEVRRPTSQHKMAAAVNMGSQVKKILLQVECGILSYENVLLAFALTYRFTTQHIPPSLQLHTYNVRTRHTTFRTA
jgi:hypothetical protein